MNRYLWKEPPDSNVELSPQEREAIIASMEIPSFQWYIDQGTAALETSDVKTPKTFTAVWHFRREKPPAANGHKSSWWQRRFEGWKVYHTATITM